MEALVSKYVKELIRQLRSMPKEEWKDIVNEIRNHIVEGQAVGKPIPAILMGLGDPQLLAEDYLTDYLFYLQKKSIKEMDSRT